MFEPIKRLYYKALHCYNALDFLLNYRYLQKACETGNPHEAATFFHHTIRAGRRALKFGQVAGGMPLEGILEIKLSQLELANKK